MHHRLPDGFCLPVSVIQQTHPLDLREEIERAISELVACYGMLELTFTLRSFAGQYKTYLNIAGADAILQAVVRCWDSAAARIIFI